MPAKPLTPLPLGNTVWAARLTHSRTLLSLPEAFRTCTPSLTALRALRPPRRAGARPGDRPPPPPALRARGARRAVSAGLAAAALGTSGALFPLISLQTDQISEVTAFFTCISTSLGL